MTTTTAHLRHLGGRTWYRERVIHATGADLPWRYTPLEECPDCHGDGRAFRLIAADILHPES